ncbi:hypothetical protein GQF01_28210 [Paenibacillus sp. 5J-6]|uniref:DUF2642 domain-containing protein n=1 Tax=Paenibacillus silvestris TaxID=2606219 RepID=A0A6L8V8L3_9BACL|nr:hypothetical protein [Paenibacillus silvestris]MZQ85992.1 hypothetical protein [Paenibacillus silvestris]
MSFAELLVSFIGRTVEVYFTNNPPIIGELISVESCYFTVQINNTYYYSPPVVVTIVVDQIDYIRVVA